MLITVDKLKSIEAFRSYDAIELERRLKAVEKSIREHTKNNFQIREIRFCGSSQGSKVYGFCPYFQVGDTVEISQSINKGLYIIEEITDEYITLDRELHAVDVNLVTKVHYDEDIIEGALKILKWDLEEEKHLGVASESETLSRHSKTVTYQNVDKENTIQGRPASLFGFCKPYRRARF